MAKNKTSFGILVLFLLLYSGVFIWQTSFVYDGKRHFVLFDDAMVSMCYARNLSRGEGLVMNPGERVEGITNPLWTFIMAGAHLITSEPSKTSLLLQLAGVFFLLGIIFFIAQISAMISPGKPLAPLLSAIFGVLYFPLLDWTLQGMEVGIAALSVLISVWYALKNFQKGSFSPWLYALLGFGILIRQDMTIPFLAMWTSLTVLDRKNSLKHLLWGGGFLVLFIGGITLARYLYYGELLPNTYYLKISGYPAVYRISRGLIVFVRFVFQKNLIIFLLPFVSLVIRFSRAKAILAWAFLLQVTYSIYVGGDAWEDYGDTNRYINTVMPLFFLLFADALDDIRLFLEEVWRRKAAVYAAWGLAATFCFIQVNIPLGVKDLVKISLIHPHSNVGFNILMVNQADIVRTLTTENATIAVTSAGTLPYFADRPIVDMLGKVDRVIAHSPMHGPETGENKWTHFFPGHLKWDYAYSFGELKPDLIVHTWKKSSEAEPYLSSYERILIGGDIGFWHMKKESPNIHWSKLVFSTQQKTN